MTSILIIRPVDKLQEEIIANIAKYQGVPGVYVSLNKAYDGMAKLLNKENIDLNSLFFIDCVTTERKTSQVIHIPPVDLDKLCLAVNIYLHELPGRKFLLIDALSTLLIYNDETKVAQFIKKIIDSSVEHDADVVAISPITKGEELLIKIFNFFDEVRKQEI